jgi:hypothetical protein
MDVYAEALVFQWLIEWEYDPTDLKSNVELVQI